MTSAPLAASEGHPSLRGRTAGAQRVLDAALDLFSEHGFAGTSLQDIADRLVLTKAAVYYHFASLSATPSMRTSRPMVTL